MTHGNGHGTGNAPDIPVSAGIPMGVRVSLILCVALVISILGMTIVSSAVGHVWPWTEAMKITL
jgi:hypothetical protein